LPLSHKTWPFTCATTTHLIGTARYTSFVHYTLHHDHHRKNDSDNEASVLGATRAENRRVVAGTLLAVRACVPQTVRGLTLSLDRLVTLGCSILCLRSSRSRSHDTRVLFYESSYSSRPSIFRSKNVMERLHLLSHRQLCASVSEVRTCVFMY